eukprot:1775056-Prymnesium_polylepis.1
MPSASGVSAESADDASPLAYAGSSRSSAPLSTPDTAALGSRTTGGALGAPRAARAVGPVWPLTSLARRADLVAVA